MGKRFLKGFLFGLGLSILFLTCIAGACNPNPGAILSEIIVVASGLFPILSGVMATLLPSEATLITSITNEALAALKALQQTIATYEANPGTTPLTDIQAAFTAAQTNLNSLLSAAQVKNPATATKITAVVTGILSSVSMLEAQILAKHPATVAAAQANTAQS